MRYRELGNTGVKVSELGMGCEGLLEKSYEVVKEFVDQMELAGMNIMDLYSPNPDMRKNLGRALKGRRESFILQAHLCSVWKDGQYKRTREIEEVKAGFHSLLAELQTDYIDIGMIHFVDSVSDWKEVSSGAVMEYAQELKKQQKIRWIGMSSHNPEAGLCAVESGLIDVLMFSVNPCYDLQPGNEDLELLWKESSYENHLVNMDPMRQKLYETAQSRNVAITVMKAFGGGDLLSEKLSPAGKALTVFQCLHYALTRPGVISVMSGARSIPELKATVGYEAASEQEKDYAEAFASFPKISWKGHCMYCGHCAPCPSQINIAEVTKYLNLARAQGEVPETVREHYGVLEHKAEECIACRACEARCPFEVKVVDNMKQAVKIFGA